MNSLQKQNGVFYTNSSNPFKHSYFIQWAEKINLKKNILLEPFAGANHIIHCLQDIGICNNFASFDISPQDKRVVKSDTIKKFPIGYKICVTNPPWLYKSRAKRLKLFFPESQWDNLYKHCLELCLKNCNHIAILIPASFLSSNIFLERLDAVIFLQNKIFAETENPVCLALFNPIKTADTKIFIDENCIGNLATIQKNIPQKKNQNNPTISFNIANGDIGLIAIDNTKEASIQFCKGSDLKNYKIQNSSRSITRLSIHGIKVKENFITKLNERLNLFRERTHDIFMTPFKGVRADGKYRRRLDFSLARKLIMETL